MRSSNNKHKEKLRCLYLFESFVIFGYLVDTHFERLFRRLHFDMHYGLVFIETPLKLVVVNFEAAVSAVAALSSYAPDSWNKRAI